MIGTRGHTHWHGQDPPRTWADWGPSFSLPGQGSADLGPAVGSQSPATGERRREWVSSDNWESVWTLCYMTLGCHYVKWQWYNSSRVMTMMRVWPRSSDIRDIIMSDRRSSILDMIRGRGKEAARRQERDAPGLERWVLGSEDLKSPALRWLQQSSLICAFW